MDAAQPFSRARFPVVVAAIGGLGAVLQGMLAWESLGGALDVNGASANGGKLIEILGLVALGLALLRRTTTGVSALLLIVGAAITAIGIGNFITVSDYVNSFNEAASSTAALAGSAGPGFSVGLGIYVAILSGVLVAGGGFLGLVEANLRMP
jgi:hypothetical protein